MIEGYTHYSCLAQNSDTWWYCNIPILPRDFLSWNVRWHFPTQFLSISSDCSSLLQAHLVLTSLWFLVRESIMILTLPVSKDQHNASLGMASMHRQAQLPYFQNVYVSCWKMPLHKTEKKESYMLCCASACFPTSSQIHHSFTKYLKFSSILCIEWKMICTDSRKTTQLCMQFCTHKWLEDS